MKNNYKYKKENYNFWVSRLKKNENLVCTNDIILDRIEEDQIINRIETQNSINPLNSFVLEIISPLFSNSSLTSFISVCNSKNLWLSSLKYCGLLLINFFIFVLPHYLIMKYILSN